MSTVVYRDGAMAADTRAYSGDRCPIGTKQKIRRLDDGSLIGCCTTQPGLSETVMRWYTQGADLTALPAGLPATPSFQLLVVKRDGTAFYAHDSWMLSGPLEAPWFAIGSGTEYAIGAMHMGADATRACEIACTEDTWSALPLTVLRHDGATA